MLLGVDKKYLIAAALVSAVVVYASNRDLPLVGSVVKKAIG